MLPSEAIHSYEGLFIVKNRKVSGFRLYSFDSQDENFPVASLADLPVKPPPSARHQFFPSVSSRLP